MKSALTTSLQAEDQAVKSRFEKAESLLGDKLPSNSQPMASTPEVKEQSPERVIRDSFTLPSGDYELIAAIRQRCLNSAFNATKSEVIRAGLHALLEMPEEELIRIISNLEKVKTGRPITKNINS
ncbi:MULTISPECIES: hypothetical protein [Trichocoleus]|uniref:Uncharacterized protein n=1 Tax=Trichocoleus desertorum GB2-A4 TaxID=2933944 RepID=A0ABV0JER9_9CYAN|nr:hypothetical protein [Trichocoleus sp. FACHB-46]